MQKDIPCVICKNIENVVVFDQPDSLYFPRRFVKCSKCGLVYVNPQPTMERLNALYNNELAGNIGARLFWDRKQKSYTKDFSNRASTKNPAKRRAELRIRAIEELRPPPARLLDVGCREGDFLLAAKARGFDVEGVELSTAIAEQTELRIGGKIFSGSVEEYVEMHAIGNSAFDIVSFWDVIEHLLDPVSTLSSINRLQKTGGLLCVSTINLRNFRYLRYGNRWHGFMESQEHIGFFSPKNIALLLRRCGYEPLKVFTRSVPPVLLRWLNLFRLGNDLEAIAQKVADV